VAPTLPAVTSPPLTPPVTPPSITAIAAPADGADRLFEALGAVVRPLAIAVTVLLFLQWPLRDLVGAWAIEANDLAQALFAVYVAVSLQHAGRRGAHLTARSDLAPQADPRDPRRRRWRATGAALLVLPWAVFVLVSSAGPVWTAIVGLEKFPGSFNPGYFVIRAALWLLAGLIALQSIVDLWRTWRPAPR